MPGGHTASELIGNILPHALRQGEWSVALKLLSTLSPEARQDVLRGSHGNNPLEHALRCRAPEGVRRALIPRLPEGEDLVRLLSRRNVPITVLENSG